MIYFNANGAILSHFSKLKILSLYLKNTSTLEYFIAVMESGTPTPHGRSKAPLPWWGFRDARELGITSGLLIGRSRHGTNGSDAPVAGILPIAHSEVPGESRTN
jgi:hypothetical protein